MQVIIITTTHKNAEYPEIPHQFLAFLERNSIDNHKRSQFLERLQTPAHQRRFPTTVCFS